MRLVVIGGNAAGLSAATRARRLDKSLEIVVLERSQTVSFGACGLPYYLTGRVGAVEDLVSYSAGYLREKRNIEVRTGATVAAIAHSHRQVMLEGGEGVHYDRLVVATGARPDRQAIAGADEPHVFTLQTPEDGRRLRAFLEEKRPRKAAVIGAGYIGLELADALRGYAASVTIFEAASDILGRQDAALTGLVAEHLARFGVELRCQTPVTAIPEGFDVVLLAAGVKPNVELAAEAGIETGRTGAIRVDERLETSCLGVYAAGDCAETMHLVSGRPVYLPLGTTANKMGRVAGANAAGRRERFPGVAGTLIAGVCGLGVAVSGLSEWQARREGFDPVAARIQAMGKARYFFGTPVTVELVADRGTRRLLGGSVVGEDGVAGRINVIAAAIGGRLRVEEFEQLDLAYAPPFATVWDPLLIAAQQLAKLLN